MEDKLFDQIMKSKLEQVRTPYEVSSWQKLSAQMDKLEQRPGENSQIDQLIKDRIGNKEIPFNAPHWDALGERLDRMHILIQRLRTAKIAEAAILVLTLLNLDAFQSGETRWQKPASKTQEPIAQIDQNKATTSGAAYLNGMDTQIEASQTPSMSSKGHKLRQGQHILVPRKPRERTIKRCGYSIISKQAE